MLGVDHPFFVHVKVERMVGVLGIVRMAALGLLPVDHFAHIFDDGFTFGNILQGEDPLAVHAGAPDLDPARGSWRRRRAGYRGGSRPGAIQCFFCHEQKLC